MTRAVCGLTCVLFDMKKINLYFGLVLFIVFLLTGQYMEYVFKPQHFDELVMRMQVRANHIYILFISLINILAFKCDLTGEFLLKKYMDFSFRILMIASGVLMVFAFFMENSGDMVNRNLTKNSAILSIAAIGIVLGHEIVQTFIKKSSAA